MAKEQIAKASLLETFGIAGRAVRFAIETYNEAEMANDRMPMDFLETVGFLATNLRSPGWLRREVNILSSVKWGEHILDNVFPRADNPKDYHSTPEEAVLTEHPVQVMGWEEQKKMVKEGVERGFDKAWIEVGFEERAQERGIDLEFHFWEKTPGRSDKPGEEVLLEDGL